MIQHQNMRLIVEKQFWARVERQGPEDCWEWQGSRLPAGYGTFGSLGKTLYAHRVSWELHFGAVPQGLFVCHKCDNPPCCNPVHLFLGTQGDNLQDMKQKGRSQVGERHWNVKLSETQVLEIRNRYSRGQITQDELAKEFGVSQGTIWDIVGGNSWSHLPIQPYLDKRVKLAARQVQEIRRRYFAGGILQRELAAEFNVHKSAICLIVRRKTWADLPLVEGEEGNRPWGGLRRN